MAVIEVPERLPDYHDIDPERDTTNVPRAKPRQPRKRVVVDRATTYIAYSAHDLLDMDSQAKYGRPGVPY